MRPFVVAALLSVALPVASVAQRAIDLTGRPVATLSEPFSRISGLQELPDARVLVTDPMEGAIILGDFASGSGRPVGRRGEGPNEFRFPATLLTGAGGVVLMPDPVLARLLRITANGIESGARFPDGFPGVPSFRAGDAMGRLYAEGSSFNPETGRFTDSVPLLRWDPARGAPETLAKHSTGGRVILGSGENISSIERRSAPYPHLDAWVVLPDGRVAIVRPAPYRIDFVDAPGRITAGTPIATTPIPLGAKERAAFRDEAAQRRSTATTRSGGGGMSGPPVPAFEDRHFPATLPPFRWDAVLATPDGEIWIGRSAPAGADRASYDIHDGTGRLVARATLRAGSTVVGFGKGVVYVARKSPDDDLLHLEKYRR